ncbi:Ribonuclease H protein [Quillaja saponaria]|uniref:Ribonuclease H protein n=1 Tax=Quillaja saponaria TaxID=32244 RepID=A0AAD7PMT6_QUISA|nr:Ribonuclease H protein [Quillaja saponaria]
MVWEPPEFGWLKLNVDGLTLGKPGPARIGGVLRDQEGNVKAMFSNSIGIADSNSAKLKAICGARNLVASNVIGMDMKVIVESDSTIATNWVKNVGSRPWKYDQLFTRIEKGIGKIKRVKFKHVGRSANNMENSLAKLGVARKDPFSAWF